MKKLYVISGMTGMTGNELARQIVKRGDNFFASSTETIKDVIDSEHLEFFEGDINNDAQMKELEEKVTARKAEYEKVIYINCAAVVHTEHFYHVDRTFETNVIGMKKFLEQAIRVGADSYINCSTSEVYSMASWKEGGVKEDDFLLLATAEHSQRTSYATGKLLTEFFMKDAVERGMIKGCSLRFANVYSHNIDSCAAVLAVADTDAALDGTVYNVATEQEVSMIELVDVCAKAIGIEKPEIIFEGYRESDPQRRVLSAAKIKARTGWKPTITLEQGIKMCVDYRRQVEGK